MRFSWCVLSWRRGFLVRLEANGELVGRGQRDLAAAGAGLAFEPEKTYVITFATGETGTGGGVADRHALLIDVPPGSYTLIAGLYDLNDPSARLPVNGDTYLTLATITITGN